ncbi:MAG: TolC family protein [Acidobacteriota bacterium]|nr:TolC family protein [Acidobacteriota bacterium]
MEATEPPSIHLTLAEAVRAAEESFPRRQEQKARRELAEERLENLDRRFRPQLEVQGQAAYHSEVPSLPAGLAGSPPKDQYTLELDTDQRLWDGGRTNQEQAVERAARDVDLEAVDVAFQDRREQIEEAYFAVLLRDAELELLSTLIVDLESQMEIAEARIDAGVALEGDRAVLLAEFESQHQRILEALAERRGALDVLATLTGRPLPDPVRLAVPQPELPEDLLAVARSAELGEGVERPEIDQARAMQRLFQEQLALAGLAQKPTVSAFARAGVGRPPDQDFFEDEPTPFFVVGLRMRWQPVDWGVSEREQQMRRLEQEISGARLATFLQGLSARLQQSARRIEALRELLESDRRIVEQREITTAQADAQLRGGVITSTQYLLERNAEHRARLNQEQHRLRLARAGVDFLTTLGASP